MTIDVLFALICFACVMSITPGPNNMMVLASGVNFGYLRTVPHIFGIAIGHGFLVFLVGLGLVQLLTHFTFFSDLLKICAVGYMLWLAWKLAHAAAPSEARGVGGTPLGFWQAVAFQWVNPKGIASALSAATIYAQGAFSSVVIVALVFSVVNMRCVSIWAYAGQKLRLWLTTPARLRGFNWSMAFLLVLSIAPIVF